jgi:hypothetical protein
LKAGDAGCVGGAGVGNVAAVEPEPPDGSGGASTMLCNSGAAGLGIKIVLRTSRRPRNVEERFGGAACCCVVRSPFQNTVDGSYCTQSVDHVRHSRIGIAVLFLDWRVFDVELELRSWVTLGLDAAF